MRCIVYANDSDDQFPNELADLVTFGVMTEKVLNRLLTAPGNPDGPPEILNRQPRPGAKDWSIEVILHERYDTWPEEGVVVCFADSHCEVIRDQSQFEVLIK